jgi:hypothetical protein
MPPSTTAFTTAPTPQQLLEAIRETSRYLHEKGVPHALVGACAMAMHGYFRTTTDVDFLVGEPGFSKTSAGFLILHDLPNKLLNIQIDCLPANTDELKEVIHEAVEVDGIPVATVEALIAMKRASPRLKDKHDAEALLEQTAVLSLSPPKSPVR